MIARTWSARTTPENAPAYAEHLRTDVIPTLRSVSGYAGASLLQRDTGDGVEVAVITLWESLAAIKGFAGSDIERAVVTDEAAALFTGFDDRVRHYEVVLTDEP